MKEWIIKLSLYTVKGQEGRQRGKEKGEEREREVQQKGTENPPTTDGLCHFEFSLPKEQTLVEAIKASVCMRKCCFNIDGYVYVTSVENKVIEIYP